MADRVVIVGVKCAGSKVPASTLKQMAGRAGRVQGGDEGHAHYVVGMSEIDELKEDLENEDNFAVSSVLGFKEELSFHLLPEIVNLKITNYETALIWYKRSFHSFLGGKVNLKKAIDVLIDCESIIENNGRLVPTPLGNIASQLYFHPEDVKCWEENFSYIFESELEDKDYAIAWALSNVIHDRKQINLQDNHRALQMYKDETGSQGLYIEDGTYSSGVIWGNILGGAHLSKMNHEVRIAQSEFSRICRALKLINAKSAFWNKTDFFDNLSVQVRYRISNNLVNLCKIDGIGKTCAMSLYNIGIREPCEFKDKMSDVESLGNLKLLNTIKRYNNGI